MEIAGLFICKCERCIDPTELGTYLSALKCQNCPTGYLLPVDPVDSFSDWYCSHCPCVLSDEEAMDIIEDAEMSAGYPKKDILGEEDVNLLLEYVETFSGRILHPRHYILFEVNARILAAQHAWLEKMTGEELDGFIQRCQELIKTTDVIMPGYNEQRGE